jgi:hypothetical protein
MARKRRDTFKVTDLCIRCEIAQLHIFDHFREALCRELFEIDAVVGNHSHIL